MQTPNLIDPNYQELDLHEFLTDLVTNIREFNDLLESIEDVDAFLITEVAFVEFVDEMEEISGRAVDPIEEPKEEDREELWEMLDDLKIQVLRLGRIEQQKRSNTELWKLIDPLFERFESSMRMVPFIPPKGMPDENPGMEEPESIPDEPAETEKPESIPDEPAENPGTEKPESIPDEPAENPGTEKPESIPDEPGTP